jgi:hypothetical protein
MKFVVALSFLGFCIVAAAGGRVSSSSNESSSARRCGKISNIQVELLISYDKFLQVFGRTGQELMDQFPMLFWLEQQAILAIFTSVVQHTPVKFCQDFC